MIIVARSLVVRYGTVRRDAFLPPKESVSRALIFIEVVLICRTCAWLLIFNQISEVVDELSGSVIPVMSRE